MYSISNADNLKQSLTSRYTQYTYIANSASYKFETR